MARTRAAKPATTQNTDAAQAASGDSTLDLSTLTRAQLGEVIDTTAVYIDTHDRLAGFIDAPEGATLTRDKAVAFVAAARAELDSRPIDAETETW